MLGSIFNLFGRSPFALLGAHMLKVSEAVHLLPALFASLENHDYEAMNQIANQIGELEDQADRVKEDIRNHLPKSLFLPIDHTLLLEILMTQDKIADGVGDVAVLITIKRIEFCSSFVAEFKEFLIKNIQTFDAALLIIKEMHELLESSFGGIEAEKVSQMIKDVSMKENEVDMVQRGLLKKLFNVENEMPYTTFYLWQKICEEIAAISDFSEKLALRIRLTLEKK